MVIKKIARDQLEPVFSLNKLIFGEERLINSLRHTHILCLGAWQENELIGFKIGYDRNEQEFYSAKGGVHPKQRRKGIARQLLHTMLLFTLHHGYQRFIYDTFPNMHPAMLILGLHEGFRVSDAKFNTVHNDFQITLERRLRD